MTFAKVPTSLNTALQSPGRLLVGVLALATSGLNSCRPSNQPSACVQSDGAAHRADPAEQSIDSKPMPTPYEPSVFYGIRFTIAMGVDNVVETGPDGGLCYLRCGTHPDYLDRTFSVTIDLNRTVTVKDAYGSETSGLSEQELAEYDALRARPGMLAATQALVADSQATPCPSAPEVKWNYQQFTHVVDEQTGLLVVLDGEGCITGTSAPSSHQADIVAMLHWLRELGRSRVICEMTHEPQPDFRKNEWLRPLCVFDWECALGIGNC